MCCSRWWRTKIKAPSECVWKKCNLPSITGCNADIYVTVKIESADSIPNLTIISASGGVMVARGDLGAELPVEEVPLLQWQQTCLKVDSMSNHPTPTRAEVSDIAIAVQEGADASMLSGETARYPIKTVKVMHAVALKTESSLLVSIMPPVRFSAYKIYDIGLKKAERFDSFMVNMGAMFAFHSTTMANTLNTPIIVFTRTGSMAILLSHYHPFSSITSEF
ncbi:hypothetical protein DITRI_Ditri07aG0166200 [Diplodiscus trichospermus]